MPKACQKCRRIGRREGCEECIQIIRGTHPQPELRLTGLFDENRQRDVQRRREYGLSRRQFDDLRRLHLDHCGGCGEGECELQIDHDHKTGKVRGLLCRSCNVQLEKWKDSPPDGTGLANYMDRIAQHGTRTRAAKALGISTMTLRTKLASG